jgi:tellurite resistance protein TerC
MMHTVGSTGLWIGFSVAVATLLIVDIVLAQRRQGAPSLRQSSMTCIFWLALALAFAAGLYHEFGRQRAVEFLTGYCIEEALSIDNLFVFLLIFGHFKVPEPLQHRVLRWGIFGALAMRAGFIVIGAALLERFHWVFYVLGAFLLVTAVRLLTQGHDDAAPDKSPVTKLLLRIFPWPVTDGLRGPAFFVMQAGRRHATPLALALCVVELSDVLFALDSVPAIFAVTTDAFVVYTSNVFAILGLRSLYFLLVGMLEHFRYLKVGLGIILGFVGSKMLLHAVYPISAGASLAVVLGTLLATVIASWCNPPPKAH